MNSFLRLQKNLNGVKSLSHQLADKIGILMT